MTYSLCMKFFVCLLAICIPALSALGQQSDSDRKANARVEPFHLIGDVYYVGAAEVTSFLITTPKGHILIDAGFPETASQIVSNVKKLGYEPRDIKILLNTQAHYDHAGGLAELKRVTGSRLIASAADKSLLERGGKDDFAFGDTLPYEPVRVDEILHDAVKISLGHVSLKPVAMPGHTKGATAYVFETLDSGKKYKVLFFSSVTTPGYKLYNAKYPELVTDLTKTLAKLKKLSPDVFLASHGSFFNLADKASRRRTGASPNPFVDKSEFPKFLVESEKAFRSKLADQRKSVTAAATSKE